MSLPAPIRILIADDHPVVRAGIAAMLEIDPAENLQVVGQVSNGRDAIEQYAQLQPDITLIDLRMPEVDGVAAIAAIRAQFSDARLIILTTYDHDEAIYQGLRAGAQAYLLKDAPRDILLQCIRTVAAGRSFLSPEVSSKFLERMNSPQLSDREHQVLHLVATGKTNQEIGEVLSIASGTVKFHINNILSKLEVGDRTGAVVKALKRGIIQL